METIRRQLTESHASTYHRLSPQGEEELASLLKIPQERKELKRILRVGFSLEEILAYQEYFPSDFHLSLTELNRLTTGKRRLSSTEEKNQIIKALEEKNITVTEEVTGEGVFLHKVPLSEVEEGVALLKRLKPRKPF